MLNHLYFKKFVSKEVKASVLNFRRVKNGYSAEVHFTNLSDQKSIVKLVMIRFPDKQNKRGAIANWSKNNDRSTNEAFSLPSRDVSVKKFFWFCNHENFLHSQSNLIREPESAGGYSWIKAVIHFYIIDAEGNKHLVPYTPFKLFIIDGKLNGIMFRSDVISLLPSPVTNKVFL